MCCPQPTIRTFVRREDHVMTKPTVCAVFAGLLMFAVAPQVRAGDECSVADLRGDYSFILSGTIVNVPGLAGGPCAAAGRTTDLGHWAGYGATQASLYAGPFLTNWTARYTV